MFKAELFLKIALIIVCLTVVTSNAFDEPQEDSLHKASENIGQWAIYFGRKISEVLNLVTNITPDKVKTTFSGVESRLQNSKFNIKPKYGENLLKDIKSDMEKMLVSTMQSLTRAVEQAENLEDGYTQVPGLKFEYLNARKLVPIIDSENSTELPESHNEFVEGHNTLHLKKEKRLKDIPVNLNKTTVHVPINVYDQADSVINAIKWSSDLDYSFKSSYEHTPSISWQYFCSSAGFLRQYPGVKWAGMKPDLYDCRVRNWYIQAAASPKDMVILLDLSGSMAGLRKEIAKHVVSSLLDTLTANDHVAVMNFSESADPLVPCFGEELVPATVENIRAFKTHLDTLETQMIANFNDSLIKAFQILDKASKTSRSSHCNKAIMIITDGAPYTFESLFRKYNWNEQNSTVRIFTYLIGREVTKRREVKWMACANFGYFSHVTTLSEVREQILKYIPVLSRPLAINNYHPVAWTNVYADIADPLMSDDMWNTRIKKRTRRIMKFFYGPSGDVQSTSESVFHLDDYYISYEYTSLENPNDIPGFSRTQSLKFMTTASMPVLVKKKKLETVDLLGVVGVDITIENIKELLLPYKLGANGYAFAVTNNGHILFHPDFRPLFDDILKPNYNSVDLTEVELIEMDSEPRDIHEDLKMLRQHMIDRKESKTMKKIELSILEHLDRMKRVTTRTNSYYFTPLVNTSFTLGIALPKGYGHQEIVGRIDITKSIENSMSYLSGNWSVHPKWVYCQYRNRSEPIEITELLKEVLRKEVNVDWNVLRVPLPLDTTGEQRQRRSSNGEAHALFCDRELIESMFFDAGQIFDLTENYRHLTAPIQHYDEKRILLSNFGISSSFIGTRSGFTKYKIYPDEASNENYTVPPDKIPDRTIDELYYKLAVDYHSQSSNAFVFNVPIDAYRMNYSDIRITASKAIFINSTSNIFQKSVPWGVAAVNMKYSVFASKFLDGLTNCTLCNVNCSSDSLRCFLLDSNALVVVSDYPLEIGKFFGEIDMNWLNALVERDIYKGYTIYDYQGVCLDVISTTSAANFILSPLKAVKSLLGLVWSQLMRFAFEASILDWWHWATAEEPGDGAHVPVPLPNKTRLRPCDKEIMLYKYQGFKDGKPMTGSVQCSCDQQFIATEVPRTNLVLFVVKVDCPCPDNMIMHEPIEVFNNGSDPICQQNKRNVYRRSPPWKCESIATKEESIDLCGGAHGLNPSYLILIVSVIACYFFKSQG